MNVGDYVTVEGCKEVCQVTHISRHGVYTLRTPGGNLFERVGTELTEAEEVPILIAGHDGPLFDDC